MCAGKCNNGSQPRDNAMKTCQDFESLLSLFSNNELAAEAREAVALHLVTCAACRQKVEDYHELKKYLSRLPAPELPENLFADFHQGVLEKITHRDKTQRQRLGLIAVLYALYRRQRFLIAVATLVLMMAITTWLTHERNSRSMPRSSLTQLLEKRDWTELYYAMNNNDSLTNLLDEPVSAQLLQSALKKLMKAQQQNPRMRLALKQVLSRIKTPGGNFLSLGRSVRILGKISARGYESAPRPKRNTWNPENSLLALQQIEANETITMRKLLFQKQQQGEL